MDSTSYKTGVATKDTIQKKWFVVDANGQSVGRLASKVAKILRGKHKPDFTPHMDCGDNVIVLNADKVNLTGKKWRDKTYDWYTGYPGGLRSITAEQLHRKHPTRVVEKAVKNMLPKNRLGRRIFSKNLHVYSGDEHEHKAQKPEKLDLNSFK